MHKKRNAKDCRAKCMMGLHKLFRILFCNLRLHCVTWMLTTKKHVKNWVH